MRAVAYCFEYSLEESLSCDDLFAALRIVPDPRYKQKQLQTADQALLWDLATPKSQLAICYFYKNKSQVTTLNYFYKNKSQITTFTYLKIYNQSLHLII